MNKSKAQISSEVIEAGYPPGNINLLEVLQTALDEYFARKAAGKTKANGEMIYRCCWMAKPSDRMAVAKMQLKQQRHKMDVDEELGHLASSKLGERLDRQGLPLGSR